VSRLKGVYVLDAGAFEQIYGPAERADIAELLEICGPPQTAESIRENMHLLAEADVILSGWGAPHMDESFLAAAPRLKAVFYGAGSISRLVSEAFWGRGILVTSAYAANAVPVAEYALAMILFSLKRGWHFAMSIEREKAYPARTKVPGCYGSTVGIVSLGMIGRKLCELLRPFELRVVACDPFTSSEDAERLDVELLALDELFRRSDAVSLHAPWLPETEGMVTGELIAGMKENASLINTSRGAIIRERELIEVAANRPDLQFVLDVTHPEPPEEGSPLYTLPNVVLTPHVAGSMDDECRRMGRYMVEELRRFLAGEPLKYALTSEHIAGTSHSPR